MVAQPLTSSRAYKRGITQHMRRLGTTVERKITQDAWLAACIRNERNFRDMPSRSDFNLQKAGVPAGTCIIIPACDNVSRIIGTFHEPWILVLKWVLDA